jgi:hypothetical protein
MGLHAAPAAAHDVLHHTLIVTHAQIMYTKGNLQSRGNEAVFMIFLWPVFWLRFTGEAGESRVSFSARKSTVLHFFREKSPLRRRLVCTQCRGGRPGESPATYDTTGGIGSPSLTRGIQRTNSHVEPMQNKKDKNAQNLRNGLYPPPLKLPIFFLVEFSLI